MNRKYNNEIVQDILKKHNLLLFNNFIAINKKISCKDYDGYLYECRLSDIKNGNKPKKFAKSNPYVIYNITQYIKLNHINVELISDSFINSSTLLTWKCKCGNIYQASWNSFYNHNKHQCNDCGKKIGANKRKVDIDYIKNILINDGYKPLDNYIEGTTWHQYIDFEDSLGYRYSCLLKTIIEHRRPNKFYNSNKFSIYNINRWLNLNGMNNYVCLSHQYISNSDKLKFIHLTCGTVFHASLVEIKDKKCENNKDLRYKRCPYCYDNLSESRHARILKQIFIHEYSDTIIEERSCVNPKTKYSLPTDIVNHRLKIAIEVQSSYHDTLYQKEKDNYKKNYWINKGYNFYSPDIRDYSIIEMIQLFFPNITSIPSYVKLNDDLDKRYKTLQSYLDMGYSTHEISHITGLKYSYIYSLIYKGILILPEQYKEKVLKIQKIIQLTKDNQYIQTFDSLSDANRCGYKSGTVRRVLIGEQKYSYGYKWMYEKDYLQNVNNI